MMTSNCYRHQLVRRHILELFVMDEAKASDRALSNGRISFNQHTQNLTWLNTHHRQALRISRVMIEGHTWFNSNVYYAHMISVNENTRNERAEENRREQEQMHELEIGLPQHLERNPNLAVVDNAHIVTQVPPNNEHEMVLNDMQRSYERMMRPMDHGTNYLPG